MSDGSSSRAEQVRELVQRLAGQVKGPLEDLLPAAALPVARVPGAPVARAPASPTASEALERVMKDRALEPKHVAVLEAIILPGLRPVLDVVADSFKPPVTGPWSALSRRQEAIEAAIRVTGRVEVLHHPWLPYAGTAFLVGPDLLLTNRHVAEVFISGLGTRELRFHPGRSARVDLKQEVAVSEPLLLQVVSALLVHPHWDAALLKVSGVPAGRRPLSLMASEPPGLAGRDVAVIGYPALDPNPASNPELQLRIFNGVFQRKRLQPGKVTGYRDVDSYAHPVQALAHDCSTLGGNSGSVVLDLKTGQVLGLHFAGQYLVSNYAVPAWALAQDPRVVDLGVSLSGTPDRSREPAWFEAWKPVDEAPPKPEARPVVVGPREGRGGSLPPGAWYDRLSDADLALALRREPAEARRRLEVALGPERARALVDALEPAARNEGLFPDPEPDPDKPTIIYLHGILGAHLEAASSRVWLNPLALMFDNMGLRLRLDPDGQREASGKAALRPGQHLKLVYEDAARAWRRAGFPVRAFSFDWRKGVAVAADKLHLFIETLNLERPGHPMVLVGHSMGGLVAAIYSHRHPTWADRVQRAVFLGAPLGGSFAASQFLMGVNPIQEKWSWLMPSTPKDALRQAGAAAPGLIDMLPNRELFPEVNLLYTQDGWPDDGCRPAQRWLDQSLALKPRLADAPLHERATSLMSLRHGTVSSLDARNGRLVHGPANGAGDGTVPARAAFLPALPAFEVQSEHAQIPRDPAAIRAVMDLVASGRCSLPPVTPAAARATVPIAEAPLEKPASAARLERVRRHLKDGDLRAEDLDWLLSPKPDPAAR